MRADLVDDCVAAIAAGVVWRPPWAAGSACAGSEAAATRAGRAMGLFLQAGHRGNARLREIQGSPVGSSNTPVAI